MRVLLTNWRLDDRAGSELYLLDVARWLRDHGHVPIAYSPRLGPFAEEIRTESIAVVDDLRLMTEPPDVIHGQHHLSTMTAISKFPGVPVVAWCHGWVPWEEMPIRHPAIRRYVAISAHTRERMVSESGVDPSLVTVIPNFVDTERFRARAELPDQPGRALLFSNYAVPALDWVGVVHRSCAARGIDLTIAGVGSGNVVDCPEDYLLEFDLVFAKARAAIEAMSTGAAVILCDQAGLGPLVTPENFDQLADGNFGMRVLRSPHEQALVEAAIDGYQPGSARAVTALVRASRSRDHVVPRITRLYADAIDETARRPTDPGEAADSLIDYLYELNKLDPAPTEPIRHHYETRLTAAYRALDRLHDQENAIPDLQRQVTAVEADRAAAVDSVTAVEAELALMRNSTSWRATRPLRILGGWVRSAVRKRQN